MLDRPRLIFVTTPDADDHNFSHKCWKRTLADIGVRMAVVRDHDKIDEAVASAAPRSDDVLIINVKLRHVPECLDLHRWSNQKVFFESDAFLNFSDAAPREISLLGKLDRILRQNDFAAVVVRDLFSCEKIRRSGRLCVWSPHAAAPEACQLPDVPRTVDAAFVGTMTPWMYPERRSLADVVRRAVPNATIFGESQRVSDGGYVNLLNTTKLFISSPIGPPTIPQVTEAKLYEAMLAGCCVLRRRTLELDRLGFISGEHYVTFETHAELESSLHALLRDDDKRRRIAHNGMRFVSQYHTWAGRAAHLLIDLASV